MQDALWRLQVAVVEASGKEPRETQIEAAELQAVFEQRLLEAEQSCYTAEEKTLIKAVREHYSVYLNHIQERLRPQGLAELLIPQTAEKEKTIRLARAVAEPCRQLLELNERMLAEATERSARLSSVVNVFRFVFLVAGPILGVLYGLWIARGMHRSDFANQCHAQGSHGGTGPGTEFGGSPYFWRPPGTAAARTSRDRPDPACCSRTRGSSPTGHVGRASRGGR